MKNGLTRGATPQYLQGFLGCWISIFEEEGKSALSPIGSSGLNNRLRTYIATNFELIPREWRLYVTSDKRRAALKEQEETLTMKNCPPAFQRLKVQLQKWKGDGFLKERYKDVWEFSQDVLDIINKEEFWRAWKEDRVNAVIDFIREIRNRDRNILIVERGSRYNKGGSNLDLDKGKYDLNKRFNSLRFSLPDTKIKAEWLNAKGFTMKEYEAGYYSKEIVQEVRVELNDLWQETNVIISIADAGSGKTTLSSILFHEMSIDEDDTPDCFCLEVNIEDWVKRFKNLEGKLLEAIESILTESNKTLYALIDNIHLAWPKAQRIIDQILKIVSKEDKRRVKILALSRPSSVVQADVNDENQRIYREYEFPKYYAREFLLSYLREKGKNILDYKKKLRPLLEQDSNIFSLLSRVDSTVSLDNYSDMIVEEIYEYIGNKYYSRCILFSLSIFRKLEIPLKRVDFLQVLQLYIDGSETKERALLNETLTILEKKGYLNSNLFLENLYMITIHPYIASIIAINLEEKLRIPGEGESLEVQILTEWLKDKSLEDYKRLEGALERREQGLFWRLDLAKIDAHKNLLEYVRKHDYLVKIEVYRFLMQSPSYDTQQELLMEILSKDDVKHIFKILSGEEKEITGDIKLSTNKSIKPRENNQLNYLLDYIFSNGRLYGEFLSYIERLDRKNNFTGLYKLFHYIPSKYWSKSIFQLFSQDFIIFLTKNLIPLETNDGISYEIYNKWVPLINSRPDISWNEAQNEVIDRVLDAVRNFECHISFVPNGTKSNILEIDLYRLVQYLKRQQRIQNIFQKSEESSKSFILDIIDQRSAEDLVSYLTFLSLEFPSFYHKLVDHTEIKKTLRAKIEREITDATEVNELQRFFKPEEELYKLNKLLVLYHLDIAIKIETYATFSLFYNLFSVFLLLLLDTSQLIISLRRLPFANWHDLTLNRRIMDILENRQKRDSYESTLISLSREKKQDKKPKFADLREIVEQSDMLKKITLIKKEIKSIFREVSTQKLTEKINEIEALTPELLDLILTRISTYKEQTNFELYKLLENDLTLVLKKMDKNLETSKLFTSGYIYEERGGGITIPATEWGYPVFPFHKEKSRQLKFYEEQTKYEVLKERIWTRALSSNLAPSSKRKVYKYFIEVCCNLSRGRKYSLWFPKLNSIDTSLLVISLIKYGDIDRLVQIYDVSWIERIENESLCKELLEKVEEHVMNNKQNDHSDRLYWLLSLIARQYFQLLLKKDDLVRIPTEDLVTKCFAVFSKLNRAPKIQLSFLKFLSQKILIQTEEEESPGNEKLRLLFNIIDIEIITRLFLIDMGITSINALDNFQDGRNNLYFPINFYSLGNIWNNILQCNGAKDIPSKFMQTIDFSYYPKEERGRIYLLLDSFFKDNKNLIKRLRGEAKELQKKHGVLYLLDPLCWEKIRVDDKILSINQHINLMCEDESIKKHLRTNFQAIITKMNRKGIVLDHHLILLIMKLWPQESEENRVVNRESCNSQIDNEFPSESFAREIKTWEIPSLKALFNILSYHRLSPELARELIPRKIVIEFERQRLELTLFNENVRVFLSILGDNNDSYLEEIFQPFGKQKYWNKNFLTLLKERKPSLAQQLIECFRGDAVIPNTNLDVLY